MKLIIHFENLVPGMVITRNMVSNPIFELAIINFMQ